MAGHELKTPLTCLCLQVEGIRRTIAKSGPADLEKLGLRVDLNRQLGRLAGLVEGLLDVSWARAGRVVLKVEDVDLAQIVRDVATRFGDELAGKGYALSLHLEGPILGFGLGLWIAKQLVEAMSGRIEVQSAVGTGTSFRALLPLKTEPGGSWSM